MTSFISLLASFLAVVVVLTLHEFSHAFVAYKCGDPTAKWSGRMTLNPMKHFDLVGLLCFAFVGFGWAKPVPVNAGNFRKYRLGMGLTASAGIIMNYLCAFLFYPLYMVVICYGSAMPDLIYSFCYYLTWYLFAYSLNFCVFNLLPLFPLDGFRILDAVNKKRGKIYRFLRDYGYYILLALIIESFICNFFVNYLGVYQMSWFNILGWIMTFATNVFGWPVKALWGLIPW